MDQSVTRWTSACLDLRERVHRGLAGQAQKHYWCGGRPYGYRLKPILDASRRDAYGQPSRIGTVLEIDQSQADFVQEIFSRFVEGASCLSVARELNARRGPEPGFDLEAQDAALQRLDGVCG
jgi:site-specific DNA recombinase